MVKRNEKTAAFLEAAYLAILAVISLMAFNYTTMSGIDFPGWLRHGVLILAALIAGARLVFDRRLGWPALALGVLFALNADYDQLRPEYAETMRVLGLYRKKLLPEAEGGQL